MLFEALKPTLAFNLVLGVLLFLPAGTVTWSRAWMFIGLFDACALIFTLWLRRRDPELLAARMKRPDGAGQRPRDRMIIRLLLAVCAAWLAFMAVDARRYGWSALPGWSAGLGGVLIVLCFFGWARVLRWNRFAVTTVEVQRDRGHTVISEGPYAVVRHPMYAFALALLAGVPLLLGSAWGLLFPVLAVPLIATRALGEEALLRAELPGYAAYAGRVRHRLVPGIW